MSWNVQYMAGTQSKLFGMRVEMHKNLPNQILKHTLEEVAKLIILEEPDIILLQELDDKASRSYHQDQLKELLSLLPADYQSYCSAFYWKAMYVPHPQINGKVGMKLAVISKFKINGALRHQLPLIDREVKNWYDPLFFWVEKQFHLKRAILEVSLPTEKGGHFTVFNTHLTAYPGDGHTVLSKQVSQIEGLLQEKDQLKIPWVIGGDFNLLPPGISADELALSDGENYNAHTEIRVLYDLYEGVPDLEEVKGENAKHWLTYIPNKSRDKKADRTLDYFFVSRSIDLKNAFVVQQNAHQISDHYPVTIYIRLPDYE